MDPISSSNGFNMLGMNIGGTESDYRMLHKRVRLYEGETFEDILSEYKRLTNLIDKSEETAKNQALRSEDQLEPLALKHDREPVEERLFYMLYNSRTPIPVDPDDKVLVDLLFKKGLDILEFGLHQEAYKQLIGINIDALSHQLADSIADPLGAYKFGKLHPELCSYLSTHHEASMPAVLRENFHKTQDQIIGTLIDEFNDSDDDSIKKLTRSQILLLLNDEGIVDNPELATFLINEAPDFLELHIGEEAYVESIKKNVGIILDVLIAKITNKEVARAFRDSHPQLVAFLRDNHNNALPKYLKRRTWERVRNFFKKRRASVPIMTEREAIGDDLRPLEKGLLRIKHRLAENFFKKVVSSTVRPGIISLQEVGLQNDNVLGILKNANYEVFRSRDGDTAIALDIDRFYYQFLEQVSQKSATVYAQDKKTGENFIFISVHIPGFKLEFPSADATQQELDTHLANVEGYLMSSHEEVKQINKVIAELKERLPDAKIIVQGDFNAFPEYFEDPRLTEAVRKLNLFKPFQDNNLDLERTGEATEYYTPVWETKLDDTDPDPYRKLDHLVADRRLRGRVELIPPEKQELILALLNRKGPDATTLFSDHAGIFWEIKK